MLALKITDQKNFTNKLFLGDTFDLFWLNQAEIITSNVFSIDGKLQTDFFDNDEQEFLASSHRDRKSTRLNSSHDRQSRMPSSA